MHKADFKIEIFFDISEPWESVIKTNAHRDLVGEILNRWLSTQPENIEDDRQPHSRITYTFIMDLILVSKAVHILSI